MDPLVHYRLSRRFSAERHSRHAVLNDVVKWALYTVALSPVFEPLGMDRGDAKIPYDITLSSHLHMPKVYTGIVPAWIPLPKPT